MTYADAQVDITRRRKGLGWNRGQLGHAARLSPQTIYRFETGRWPDTDYRDWLRQQIEAALTVEEGRRQAA